jgi:thiamine-monophosphate kinase
MTKRLAQVSAGQAAQVIIGPGDDAAVVGAPDGRVVATTDLLIEGRHFRTDWSGGADIGHKAAARNLADVVAMGATPTALLVGFAGPGRLLVDWVLELAAGIAVECAQTGAVVVGGDTSSAELVLLAITAFGDLGGRPPVTRSGARPGDVVAVAGTIGSAAAGLALLTAGILDALIDQASWDDATLLGLVGAHRRPQPPYSAGPQAAMLGATSMIDVSDGLVADLGHIAAASGVRIELNSALLNREPVANLGALRRAAAWLGEPDLLPWVLTGGDDHALVATFPPEVDLPTPWQIVGMVAKGNGVTVNGTIWSDTGGWEHFRS